jgi:hypothetical protein
MSTNMAIGISANDATELRRTTTLWPNATPAPPTQTKLIMTIEITKNVKATGMPVAISNIKQPNITKSTMYHSIVSSPNAHQQFA